MNSILDLWLAVGLCISSFVIGLETNDLAAQVEHSDKKEYISKPHRMDTVLSTFYWFETQDDLQRYVKERRVRGWSDCAVYHDHNFAHCDIFVVEPTYLDDNKVTTIGHEVLHGVYGPNYHTVVQ